MIALPGVHGTPSEGRTRRAFHKRAERVAETKERDMVRNMARDVGAPLAAALSAHGVGSAPTSRGGRKGSGQNPHFWKGGVEPARCVADDRPDHGGGAQMTIRCDQ